MIAPYCNRYRLYVGQKVYIGQILYGVSFVLKYSLYQMLPAMKCFVPGMHFGCSDTLCRNYSRAGKVRPLPDPGQFAGADKLISGQFAGCGPFITSFGLYAAGFGPLIAHTRLQPAPRHQPGLF